MQDILFTSHSAIPSYPPNINIYPDFYKCKEYTFILNPGDMLYIPAGWFHWVFSYPDQDKQNIAISYAVSNFDGCIYNEFYYKKPYKFTLNKNEHDFFNYNFNTFKENTTKKINVIKSTKNILIPVNKHTLKNKLSYQSLTFSEIENIISQDTHNIYIGQYNTGLQTQWPKPPECLLRGFPTSKFTCYNWISLFKTNTEYIDSGLHYDITHGILVQIKGRKLIRLFKPQDYNNLYVQPMYKQKFE